MINLTNLRRLDINDKYNQMYSTLIIIIACNINSQEIDNTELIYNSEVIGNSEEINTSEEIDDLIIK